MKPTLVLYSLAWLLPFCTYGQNSPGQPCDIKETACVRFEFNGIIQHPDMRKTYQIRVTNKCAEPLNYVVFQLPKGMNADAPASNATYTAPSGREYTVRNPNTGPLHSIRFKALGEGIASGASDIFEYTLPPQADQRVVHAIAQLAPQDNHEVHFTIPDCKPKVKVGGTIRTENGLGIANVEVRADVTTPTRESYSLTSTTNKDGQYAFLLEPSHNYTLTPNRNNDPLNGISAFDLIQISQHILKVQLLDSPYKLIAADVNKSGMVNNVDFVILRKLILSIIPEFPENTSWRFVDVNYRFPDPSNPFQETFPETISGQGPGVAHDFIGIKTGDVNNGAAVD